MVKNLKISLNSGLISAWESIPENFRLSDIQRIVPEFEHISVFAVQKQIYAMKRLGLVDLGVNKTWHKKFAHLDTWFSNYLRKIEREQPMKAEVT